METRQPLCNVCGIPEEKWKDGKCAECKHQCDMTPSVIIEQRVYDYCASHWMLGPGETFSLPQVFKKLEKKSLYSSIPSYLRKTITELALAQDSNSHLPRHHYLKLKYVPPGKVFRVVSSEDSKRIKLGAVILRQECNVGTGNDGLYVMQAGEILPEKQCNWALPLLTLEETTMSPNEFFALSA